MKRGFLALLLLAAGVPTMAQDAPVAQAAQQSAPTEGPTMVAATVAPQPRTLAPFVASYAVYRDGEAMGEATLKLVALEDSRWRVDMGIRGTRGLVGLVGLNLQQSTLFDVADGRYRPLSQSTVRKVLFGNRKTTGVYDWQHARAQWHGDVKKTRRDAVALQAGDMSGLLINLAVLRDATPGAVLHYRFVDDGRVRAHEYVVGETREPVEVDGLGYSAMRVNRAKGGGESTTLWVTEGVPMPVRIVTRDDEDEIDLRLVDYTGA